MEVPRVLWWHQVLRELTAASGKDPTDIDFLKTRVPRLGRWGNAPAPVLNRGLCALVQRQKLQPGKAMAAVSASDIAPGQDGVAMGTDAVNSMARWAPLHPLAGGQLPSRSRLDLLSIGQALSAFPIRYA